MCYQNQQDHVTLIAQAQLDDMVGTEVARALSSSKISVEERGMIAKKFALLASATLRTADSLLSRN